MKIVVNFSPFFCETNHCWQFAKNTPGPLYDGDTELCLNLKSDHRGPGCDIWWQWAVATPGEEPLVCPVVCNTQWDLCHEARVGHTDGQLITATQFWENCLPGSW